MTCHSGPFLISSHRIVSMCNSWKLLIASHCHHGLCHLISSHLLSCLLSVFHSSHIIISSPSHLSFSQPFSADHNCFHLFSCHLSFSHLFSAHLNSSLSALLRSFSFSQLMSAHLISSLLFSHLQCTGLNYTHVLIIRENCG